MYPFSCEVETLRACRDLDHAHHAQLRCKDGAALLTAHRRNELGRMLAHSLVQHDFGLLAYVALPERAELVVVPQRTGASIARLLYLLKRPFGQRFKAELRADEPRVLAKLVDKQGPGHFIYSFWERGPGAVSRIACPQTLLARIGELHALPVERGLVARPEEWRWSTCRAYLAPEATPDDALPPLTPIPTSLQLHPTPHLARR